MPAVLQPTLDSPQLAAWLSPPLPDSAPYWVQALIGPNMAYLIRSAPSDRILFYTFAESMPEYFALDNNDEGFAPIPIEQRAAVRAMFARLEQVIDLHFVETNNPIQQGTIALMTNRQQRTDGYAWGPGFSLKAYDVMLDNEPPLKFADGQYDALTLIHEVSHALGLRHSFEGSQRFDSGGNDPSLSGAEESTVWTVMSYTSYKDQYRAELRPFDIAALQWLYGPSKIARLGDDRYMLRSTEANFIWDSAGFDTLDASGLDGVRRDYFGSPVGETSDLRLVLDLRPGTKGFIDNAFDRISLPGQITVNAGTVIEAVVGTASRDWVYGNEVANRLEGRAGDDLLVGREGDDSLFGGEGADSLMGGPGSDFLDGGRGTDWAFFEGPRSSYRISPQASGRYLIQTQTANGMQIDQLVDLERLHFSDGTVILKEDPQGYWAVRMIALLGGPSRLQETALSGYAINALDQGMPRADLARLGISAMVGEKASTRDLIAKSYAIFWQSGLLAQAPSDQDIDALNAAALGAAMDASALLLWACELPVTETLVALAGINEQGLAVLWPPAV